MRTQWVLLCALAWGCSQGSKSQQAAREQAQDPAASASPLGVRDASRESEPVDSAAGSAAPAEDAGLPWTAFARSDDVPICVFARYADWGKAQFLKDAKAKVSLKPGKELHFGTYVPGCASRECVRKVTLQCWVDVAGTALTMHTRFSGDERVGSTCSEGCEAMTAACNTPALPAGTYTLTHGDRTHTIRIPGVLHPACF
jgi:hypothetical protein